MLRNSIAAVPAGRWAVGVSGGADSVALLLLLKDRPELSLHVMHLDHQTREDESATDAQFVAELARKLGLPCMIALRSEIESDMPKLPKNISSRFRKARFALFRELVAKENLQGVLLAHHADDQAETVLLRMLRGTSPAGLAGMRFESHVQGLRILRPLLAISSVQLRKFLHDRGQIWREDSSNQSDRYQRNRLRKWLKGHPDVSNRLLEVEAASESLRRWLEEHSPMLAKSFDAEILGNLPLPLAKHSALRWLLSQGSPPREVNGGTCERLVQMAVDAASPPRQDFPGGLHVRRKRGIISIAPFGDGPGGRESGPPGHR